jgi:hypothetical protein
MKEQNFKNSSSIYKAFASTDLNRFKRGEYILFTESGVFAHGKNLLNLLEKFNKKFPKKSPFIFKIPPKPFASV